MLKLYIQCGEYVTKSAEKKNPKRFFNKNILNSDIVLLIYINIHFCKSFDWNDQ